MATEYVSVWAPLDTEGMDGVYVPIGDMDRERLRVGLEADMAEYLDEGDHPQYYMERLEATHLFFYVAIPKEGADDPATTWWDMGGILAKQVDGVWYGWSEDPGDEGNFWYQSTYTKDQAYAVRDLHIQYAEQDRVYDSEGSEYPDILGECVMDACKSVMTFW